MTLVVRDAVTITNLVNELATLYHSVTVMFHPNAKALFPVKQYAINVS
jgi:hypothetical protein